MAQLNSVTITIAASAPIQLGSTSETLGASGWAAYARAGDHHSLLADGTVETGGTAHRMYLTALLEAMHALKWGCEIAVGCNDINIVRGININIDRFRQGQFRMKQKNTDLWREIVATEQDKGHHFAEAFIPEPADQDLLAAQQRARTVRSTPDAI